MPVTTKTKAAPAAPEKTTALCEHCGTRRAANLIGFRAAGTAVQTRLVCNEPDCLLFARGDAEKAGDDSASITRLGNPAGLFHKGSPSDTVAPFVCAGCNLAHHNRCGVQVVIRRGGTTAVVDCECHTAEHALIGRRPS